MTDKSVLNLIYNKKSGYFFIKNKTLIYNNEPSKSYKSFFIKNHLFKYKKGFNFKRDLDSCIKSNNINELFKTTNLKNKIKIYSNTDFEYEMVINNNSNIFSCTELSNTITSFYRILELIYIHL